MSGCHSFLQTCAVAVSSWGRWSSSGLCAYCSPFSSTFVPVVSSASVSSNFTIFHPVPYHSFLDSNAIRCPKLHDGAKDSPLPHIFNVTENTSTKVTHTLRVCAIMLRFWQLHSFRRTLLWISKYCMTTFDMTPYRTTLWIPEAHGTAHLMPFKKNTLDSVDVRMHFSQRGSALHYLHPFGSRYNSFYLHICHRHWHSNRQCLEQTPLLQPWNAHIIWWYVTFKGHCQPSWCHLKRLFRPFAKLVTSRRKLQEHFLCSNNNFSFFSCITWEVRPYRCFNIVILTNMKGSAQTATISYLCPAEHFHLLTIRALLIFQGIQHSAFHWSMERTNHFRYSVTQIFMCCTSAIKWFLQD